MSNLAVAPDTPYDVANSIRMVRLTIDVNGRFDLFAGGLSLSGRASTSGDEATLSPDTFMNMPINRQPEDVRSVDRSAKLKGNADGTITFTQAGMDPVVLKRESQP